MSRQMQISSKLIMWGRRNIAGMTFWSVIIYPYKEALLLQYTRIANVYFLFIGILSSIPAISPVSSVTIWVPIIFVLSISLIR